MSSSLLDWEWFECHIYVFVLVCKHSSICLRFLASVNNVYTVSGLCLAMSEKSLWVLQLFICQMPSRPNLGLTVTPGPWLPIKVFGSIHIRHLTCFYLCVNCNLFHCLCQAIMKFPMDYPYSPPSVRFLCKMWHPNVYEVCDKVLCS